MNVITLEVADNGFAGKHLRGTVRLAPHLCRAGVEVAIELSWRTEGKGDVDGATFQYAICHGRIPSDPLPFELILPREPWTYHGTILKVLWTLSAVTTFDGDVSRVDQDFRLRSPFEMATHGHPHR